MIPITKPFLPPQKLYENYLNKIWQTGWITNNGSLKKELERKIADYLKVDTMQLVGSGTIALQIAIKALELKGEIITTPFSYVATTSAIVWEGCKPVFVDIDAQTLNIDPDKIEQSITGNTVAILATHIFGNPCEVEKIDEIAKKFNLKVIYDAAHCFGVNYKGESIYKWGDISIASFHATKIFHTVEGGGLFSNDDELLMKLELMSNFGHDGLYKFSSLGINGKNSEFHAAMGLCNVEFIDDIISRRKSLVEYYNCRLQNLNLKKPVRSNFSTTNYSYYPVIFESDYQLEHVEIHLKQKSIQSRRYFYPPLDRLNYVETSYNPVCSSISKRVLCLPLYYELTYKDIDLITGIINESLDVPLHINK